MTATAARVDHRLVDDAHVHASFAVITSVELRCLVAVGGGDESGDCEAGWLVRGASEDSKAAT